MVNLTRDSELIRRLLDGTSFNSASELFRYYAMAKPQDEFVAALVFELCRLDRENKRLKAPVKQCTVAT